MAEPRDPFDVLCDLEEDVVAAAGFAQILRDLGSLPNHVAPRGLYTLGAAMDDWAGRFYERWASAFREAGGQP